MSAWEWGFLLVGVWGIVEFFDRTGLLEEEEENEEEG